MFLLVSGRHVGAHPDEHQYSVSIQISIKFGKKVSPHIFHKTNCCDLNLGESVCTQLPSFFSQILDRLYLLSGFDFYFDLKTSNTAGGLFFSRNFSRHYERETI